MVDNGREGWSKGGVDVHCWISVPFDKWCGGGLHADIGVLAMGKAVQGRGNLKAAEGSEREGIG